MKKYKFITIEKSTLSGTTYTINTKRDQDFLGAIEFYPPWRQYVLRPWDGNTVWSADCLRDVIDFIENETSK